MKETLELKAARRLLVLALWKEVKEKKKLLPPPTYDWTRDWWKVEENNDRRI